MRTIASEIEVISTGSEELWMISVDASGVGTVALLFSALHLQCVEKVVFQDQRSNRTFVLQNDTAKLGNRIIPVDEHWFATIWRLLLDTLLHGWTDTAHIDQDFYTPNGIVSITFAVRNP